MLDKSSPIPLYSQLEDIIRTYIISGEWAPSQLIPSENELSKTYGISRMTARSVITSLVNEGLLYRVQGKGTFVSVPKITAKSPAYVGVREQLETQGYKIETSVITSETILANPKITKIFHVTSPFEVFHIVRVRHADGEPVSIHESYIPSHLCPHIVDQDIQQEQLCHILKNHYQLEASKINETLESIIANVTEAKLLDVPKGHPLLLLEEINTTSSGLKFEYTKIIFRGDKIKLNFEYTVNENGTVN